TDRSITFVANDGHGNSNVATATIHIAGPNVAPVGTDDSYTVAENSALTVNAPGVLANDTDANSDPLTAALLANPTNGTLSLNANGSFTYTPNANFSGADIFSYRAFDGIAYSGAVAVSINVTSVNQPPVATDDNYNVNEDN